MLNYTPWKIEQSAFLPEQEAGLEKQLAFSNGYISQYAFFEEHYSGEQSLGTYLRGITAPLPPVATISVRLGDERLDLHDWTVLGFSRCLHRQEPCLERTVTARSPQGHTIRITAERVLSAAQPQLMTIRYTVESLDYSGPISLLALMGDAAGSTYWYPLTNQIDDLAAQTFLQSTHENVQVRLAMTAKVYKNGELLKSPRIRIEKSHILGYAMSDIICPGYEYVLEKKVVFADSSNYKEFPEMLSVLDVLNEQ